MQHPGIARIYAAGSAELDGKEQPFIAMEMVQGVPITQWCQQAELGLQERVELVIQVAEALQHAHERGVIHRDLKPGNVLVDSSGSPRLLDFGVARLQEPESDALGGLTDTGQLVGTLAYMSPEQVGGPSRSLDVRSDVYSLGILGYELLAGKRPYALDRMSIPAAARVIQEQEAESLATTDQALRGDLSVIFAKALEKDPADRYGSALEMQQDLRRHLDNRPILARKSSALAQLRKFARRNRWFARGAIATLVALLAGSVGVLIFALRADEARALAQEQREQADEARARALGALAEADEARGQAELEAQKAQSVQSLFLDTLAWADPYRMQGETLTVLQALDSASVQLAEGLDLDPEVEAAFHMSIAELYEELRRDREAELHYAKSAKLLGECRGPRDPATLHAKGRLAGAWTILGRYGEAASLRGELVESWMQAAGPTDPATLAEMSRHGQCLWEAGELKRALEVGERALAGLDQAVAQDDHQRLYALLYLSYDHLQAGHGKRAEDTIREVLELAHGEGPDQRRFRLRAEAQLAAVLGTFGDPAQAVSLETQAHEELAEVVGADHPTALMSKMNLAIDITREGQGSAGIQMFEEVLEGYERVLGLSRPETLFAMQNLICAYLEDGRYARGLALAQRLHGLGPKAYPVGHPRLAWFELTRGMLLGYIGRNDEALEVLEPAVEELEETYYTHLRAHETKAEHVCRLQDE